MGQRVLWLSDWQETCCLKGVLSHGSAFTLSMRSNDHAKDSKGSAKQIFIYLSSVIWCLLWIYDFNFHCKGSNHKKEKSSLLHLIQNHLQGHCRHKHPINDILISIQSPGWLTRHFYIPAPEKLRKVRKEGKVEENLNCLITELFKNGLSTWKPVHGWARVIAPVFEVNDAKSDDHHWPPKLNKHFLVWGCFFWA